MWYVFCVFLVVSALIIPLGLMEFIYKVLCYLQWDKEQKEKIIEKTC